MKTNFFVLIAVVAFLHLTSFAFADPDTSATPNSNGVSGGTGISSPGKASRSIVREKIPTPGGDKNGPIEIQGMCSIVESSSNPIAGPCVNLVVVLNHEDGTEFVKNRTTPQGRFSLEAEAGQKYQLQLGSKLYEIVSPKGFVQAGQKVDLRVQQK